MSYSTFDKGPQLNNNIRYDNNYSINLYSNLMGKEYQTNDIINLFNGNFETMKNLYLKNQIYNCFKENFIKKRN